LLLIVLVFVEKVEKISVKTTINRKMRFKISFKLKIFKFRFALIIIKKVHADVSCINTLI
jgi:hypothetical protein